MLAFFAPETDAHDPQFFLLRGAVARNEERPERARRLLDGLGRLGLTTAEPPRCGVGPCLAVHGPDYLAFLEGAWDAWQALPGAGPEVVANAHPVRGSATRPEGVIGQAGWFMADAACPIGPGTWSAALRSAETAVAAADAVLGGARQAYALCRPPGHHAGRDLAGGHCYLNNAAIAAERLRGGHARVAVLDIDVHHGNGTQAIFWARGDVLCVSVHADPSVFYPFFAGHAHEIGEGAGSGATLNMPLPRGSGDADWLAALATACARVAAFEPGGMVLSLGLDAHVDDPFRGLAVSTEGFFEAGRMIGALPLPMVLVQEGGYLSPALGDTLAAFLGGFLAVRGG